MQTMIRSQSIDSLSIASEWGGLAFQSKTLLIWFKYPTFPGLPAQLNQEGRLLSREPI